MDEPDGHEPLGHLLPLRSSADTEGEVKRVLSKLEDSGRDLDIVALVANWGCGFRPFILMADALLHRGVLAPRLREIAILHTARALDLDYEWQEHEPMARTAGVFPAQIEQIRARAWRDASLDLFSEDELLVLECVDELATRGTLSPIRWEQACSALGRDAALEIVMGFAWWGGFVRVLIESLIPLADRRGRSDTSRD